MAIDVIRLIGAAPANCSLATRIRHHREDLWDTLTDVPAPNTSVPDPDAPQIQV